MLSQGGPVRRARDSIRSLLLRRPAVRAELGIPNMFVSAGSTPSHEDPAVQHSQCWTIICSRRTNRIVLITPAVAVEVSGSDPYLAVVTSSPPSGQNIVVIWFHDCGDTSVAHEVTNALHTETCAL